jgi:predicted DNA-binding WGR domain protein
VLKLYRFSDEKKEYWETWENEKRSHTIHWGELGTRGESKTVQSTLFAKAEKTIQKEIDQLVKLGFRPIDIDDHCTLLIEYVVDGKGAKEDVEKRHRLESRMNETLGWTGLGVCDGGSIGSGLMEVCNFVVDFEVAKAIIEKDLAGTEFANYTRIFDESA